MSLKTFPSFLIVKKFKNTEVHEPIALDIEPGTNHGF